MKKLFIIHGWDGYPEEGWFPWLKKELESKGFQVFVPQLPNPEEPIINNWVSKIKEVVRIPDENTYFVGHSIGCQAIIRYLESLPSNEKIGGVIFVAGWFNLMNLKTEKEKEIAKSWIKTPIDFEKVKQHTSNFLAVFSDNDNFVSIDNKEIFEKKLGARIKIEQQKGHFSGSDGIKELPIVLSELLKISK